MSDIFISYAREDQSKVMVLADALKSGGLSVWWDRHIQAGERFDRVIEEAIDTAKCVIVLWSEHSINSDYVRVEANEGLSRKVLIPVLIEKDIKLPLQFRRLQTQALLNWDNLNQSPEFDRLMVDISAILRPTKFQADENVVTGTEEEQKPAFQPQPRKSEVAVPSKLSQISPVSVRPLVGHTKAVTSLAYSPDGMVLASGSDDHTVRILRASDGKLLHVLVLGKPEWGVGKDVRIAFSPDGVTLATSSKGALLNGIVRLWNVANGKRVSTINLQDPSPLSVEFSPDGTIIALGSWDGEARAGIVRLWNITEGKSACVLKGHTDSVTSTAFSPDGVTLVSGSHDKTVQLWNISDRKIIRTLEASAAVKSVAMSPDGTKLAAATDSSILLWHISDGKLLHTLGGFKKGYANTVGFSPDGNILAAGLGIDGFFWEKTHPQVKLWSCLDGNLLGTLEGHTNGVTSVLFSPEGGILASGSADKSVRLWELM